MQFTPATGVSLCLSVSRPLIPLYGIIRALPIKNKAFYAEKAGIQAISAAMPHIIVGKNAEISARLFEFTNITGTLRLSLSFYNFCKIIPRGAGETKYKRLRIW